MLIKNLVMLETFVNIFQLNSSTYQNGDHDAHGGSVISSNTAPTIYGAVWLNMPTSYTSEPTYKSNNSINLNTVSVATSSNKTKEGNGKTFKFTFDNVSNPSPNNYMWIGVWAVDPNGDDWLAYTKDTSGDWVNYRKKWWRIKFWCRI